MVLKNGRVLLGLRNADAAKADSELRGEGTWTMPGGKIRMGDTFEQTASRELTEETGLAGRNFKVISISNDTIPGVQFITIGLLCEDFEGEPRVMEPEEITEWRWFPLSSLPQTMFPPSRKMAEKYLSNKFYQPNDS